MNVLNQTKVNQIVKDYMNAEERILLLDYDGTLVPFKAYPFEASPSKELKVLLKSFTTDPKNKVVIVSGRDKNTLEEWLGDIDLKMIAEHGAWIKKQNTWELTRSIDTEWKAQILALFEKFIDRLPGSFIEEKDYSVAWHYRNVDFEKAEQIVKELHDHAINITATTDIQILNGNKVIEARISGTSKDIAAKEFIKNDKDFVLAIGDDITDEDMFKALPSNSHSIKVGLDNSAARYNIVAQKQVIKLLEQLALVKA